MKKTKNPKISTLTFIGITCALVASIRNIPNVSSSGYSMFFIMIIAVILYAIPITLISGEFAGMFPGAQGGAEAWAANGLGKKWGFVTSWLLWFQIFPGMVMVASAITPLIGVAVGGHTGHMIATNRYIQFGIIIGVYWIITILNMFVDMAKYVGKFGIWLGLYIPLALVILLSLAYLIKHGVKPTVTDLNGNEVPSFLGSKPFVARDIVPTVKQLGIIAGIMFIFTGIEMSSVHVGRLKNPVRNYIVGVIAALVIMIVLNTLNGFAFAAALPADSLQNANIGNSPEYMVHALGIPRGLLVFFCVLVIVGVIIQLSSWAGGPSKAITNSARRGLYNPNNKFWKVNKHGVSNAVLITQASVISIFAFVYLIIPGVSAAFLVLVFSTAIIYNLVYIILGVALLRLRKTHPNIKRPFKLGNFWVALTIVVLLFAGILIALIFTFLGTGPVISIVMILISLIVFIIPILLFHFKNDAWVDQVNELVATTPNQNILE